MISETLYPVVFKYDDIIYSPVRNMIIKKWNDSYNIVWNEIRASSYNSISIIGGLIEENLKNNLNDTNNKQNK